MVKSKPRIIKELLTENDKISSMIIKDTVKKIGRSGYIALPQKLIGKYLEANLKVLK